MCMFRSSRVRSFFITLLYSTSHLFPRCIVPQPPRYNTVSISIRMALATTSSTEDGTSSTEDETVCMTSYNCMYNFVVLLFMHAIYSCSQLLITFHNFLLRLYLILPMDNLMIHCVAISWHVAWQLILLNIRDTVILSPGLSCTDSVLCDLLVFITVPRCM